MTIKINNKDIEIRQAYTYLQEAWSLIVTALAKNEEFLPKTWIPDLERCNFFLQQYALPKMLKCGGKGIFDGVNLLGVEYKNFTYMSVNNHTADYIDAICKNKGLNTTEQVMLNDIKWSDLKPAMNIIEDFCTFGYDQSIAVEWHQLKSDKVHFNRILEARNNPKKAKKIIMTEHLKSHDYQMLVPALKSDIFKGIVCEDKDYEYELIDTGDIKMQITDRIRGSLNEDCKIIFDNYSLDSLLEDITCSNQLYLDFPDGRFYLPVINFNGEYISLDNVNALIEQNKVMIEYPYKGHDDVFTIGDIININTLNFIKRDGFIKDKEEYKDDDYEKI